MHSQWVFIAAMTDAQSLLIAATVVILTTMVACLVYGIVSAWLVLKYPDLTKRVERMEQKYGDLKEGMQRAGTWESSYERKTPDHLQIKKDTA